MCKSVIASALLTLTLLTGCGDHIHDPWLTQGYHAEDRFHSQELNHALRHRVFKQSDR